MNAGNHPATEARDDLLFFRRYQGGSASTPEFNLPGGASCRRLSRVLLPSGILAYIMEMSLEETISMPFLMESEKTFAFCFMLSGTTSFCYDDRKSHLYYYKSPISLFYDVQDGSGTACYESNQPIRCLALHFSQEIMHRLLGEDISRWPAVTRSYGAGSRERIEAMVALSPSMRMALLQVFNFPLDGPNSLLFLESKALELINLHVLGLAMQSHRPPPNGSGYIAPNDRDKLHTARDILTRELAEPPTISALSRRVGLNECKLKQIFKVHFKTTIYGFVQNERMRLAKTLLEEGMSVSQAASALGYVNFSHFSSVFRKHYGEIPSHFKRRT